MFAKYKKKAVSPIFSGVLYVAIILVVIGIVMDVAIPQINKSKDTASFSSAKQSMYKIDKAISELSQEGEGATRIIDINLKKGKIIFNKTSDKITYLLETPYKILSPRIQKREGDLLITSSGGVSIIDYGYYYILENEVLKINITKKGTESDPETINITNLINSVYQKQTSQIISSPSISLKVEHYDSLNTGTGYIYAKETGTGYSRGTIITHIENKWATYDIYISLESKADFFNIYVRNYISKK